MCLSVWRGLDVGPYMHSIHFSYAVGAFVAPLVASPFLRKQAEEKSQGASNATTTIAITDGGSESEEAPATSIVWMFFVMSGGLTVLVSLGFLFFGREELRRKRDDNIDTEEEKNEEEKEKNEEEKQKENKKSFSLYALVTGVTLLFLFYAALEYMFSVYLTTFAVKSALQMTRSQGAKLSATFWGTFTAGRFAGIFVAAKLDPARFLNFCFAVTIGTLAALSAWAEASAAACFCLIGLLGFILAPIYASVLTWVEGRYEPKLLPLCRA